MRITTTSTALRLALAAAIMSAAPVGAFVSPALHMMAAGRGPEAPVGSKSLSPWSFSSSIGQRDVPVQRTQHAKARGGAVGPLGAVALPATDRILQTPWDGTSNEGEHNVAFVYHVRSSPEYDVAACIHAHTWLSCTPKSVPCALCFALCSRPCGTSCSRFSRARATREPTQVPSVSF